MLVDPNAVLPFSLSGQGFQSVTRRDSQFLDALNRVQQFQLPCGLFAQFVAVAEEQGGLGQLPGLAHAPQQVGGDDGLARAGGQGEQHAGGLAVLLTQDDLFKGRADGSVLVVARERPGRAVGLEQ